VTSELVMDDVRLPAGAMLPGVEGLRGPLSCLNEARFGIIWGVMGAARACFQSSLDYATSRIQFDRPIASFQAVRHRLADSLVAIEAAGAATDAAAQAWEAVAHAGDGADPVSAFVLAGIAKALAGRGARTVARHCQQVLAGIGFTTEHGFHHHLRRVLALDGLLGDARTLTRELGETLVRERRLPAAPAL